MKTLWALFKWRAWNHWKLKGKKTKVQNKQWIFSSYSPLGQLQITLRDDVELTIEQVPPFWHGSKEQALSPEDREKKIKMKCCKSASWKYNHLIKPTIYSTEPLPNGDFLRFSLFKTYRSLQTCNNQRHQHNFSKHNYHDPMLTKDMPETSQAKYTSFPAPQIKVLFG